MLFSACVAVDNDLFCLCCVVSSSKHVGIIYRRRCENVNRLMLSLINARSKRTFVPRSCFLQKCQDHVFFRRVKAKYNIYSDQICCGPIYLKWNHPRIFIWNITLVDLIREMT